MSRDFFNDFSNDLLPKPIYSNTFRSQKKEERGRKKTSLKECKYD
jgi:hypothetical protein